MAINVNTVYTTVLSILNKEQRGYLTPYEFNQLATQVQLEIFENFFEDYPIEDLKNSADAIFKKMGNITKVNEMIPENQLRGYCIIDCEKGKVRLAFTLTPENPALIQEYHLTIENN